MSCQFDLFVSEQCSRIGPCGIFCQNKIKIDENSYSDMEKAKKDLGFFPEYHLTDAFADMGEEMVRDE